MKCLIYGGILSHYTGDCMMPLHTTKDFDGKRKDMGGFLQKGIHAKIDGFPEKNGFTSEQIGRGLHHGFPLLLDIDCRVLTGELAKILFRVLQIFVHLFQTTFEKDALTPGRGGA